MGPSAKCKKNVQSTHFLSCLFRVLSVCYVCVCWAQQVIAKFGTIQAEQVQEKEVKGVFYLKSKCWILKWDWYYHMSHYVKFDSNDFVFCVSFFFEECYSDAYRKCGIWRITVIAGRLWMRTYWNMNIFFCIIIEYALKTNWDYQRWPCCRRVKSLTLPQICSFVLIFQHAVRKIICWKITICKG